MGWQEQLRRLGETKAQRDRKEEENKRRLEESKKEVISCAGPIIKRIAKLTECPLSQFHDDYWHMFIRSYDSGPVIDIEFHYDGVALTLYGYHCGSYQGGDLQDYEFVPISGTSAPFEERLASVFERFVRRYIT